MAAKFLQNLFIPWRDVLYYNRNKKDRGLSLKEFLRLKAYKYWQNLDTVTTFFNHRFKLSSPYWFLQTVEEIFIHEIYKFEADTPHPLIIDCGANWGLSVIYLKMKHPGATIVAYEADRKIYEMASENFKSFGLEQVALYNKAVWTANGSLVFSSEGSVGGSIKALEINKNDSEYNDAPPGSWVGNFNTYYGIYKLEETEVESIRLKDVLNEYPVIDFLKIDIEGAEHEVIMDCSEELTRIKKMFIEYHSSPDKPQHLDEMLSVISKSGFRYYIREAANNFICPFIRDKDILYDLQLNIFCFR